MKLLTHYRHSRHSTRPHLCPIIGPRTFTNAKRCWQVRILIDLPVVPGATTRAMETITLNTSVMPYWHAAMYARAQLAAALVEHDDWTDFAWQVWVR